MQAIKSLIIGGKIKLVGWPERQRAAQVLRGLRNAHNIWWVVAGGQGNVWQCYADQVGPSAPNYQRYIVQRWCANPPRCQGPWG